MSNGKKKTNEELVHELSDRLQELRHEIEDKETEITKLRARVAQLEGKVAKKSPPPATKRMKILERKAAQRDRIVRTYPALNSI